MPVDRKYGQVELEHQRSVEDDEPVFVFRAKDVILPKLLDIYFGMCREAGSPRTHLESIAAAREEILTWQAVNGTKVPTSEPVGIPVEKLLKETDGV